MPNDQNSAYLNSPCIDDTGKPTKKAIDSATQAKSIAESLRNKAKDGRLVTAGRVLEVYNAGPPFDETEIKKLNEDWRNNFSTHFLPSIIDRTRPQFPDPLNTAETLTYSTLPDDVEDGARKTKVFQTKITKLIRSWSQWDSFMSSLTLDEVLHGNNVPVWLSDDWRPALFGYGNTYLPQGTRQHASQVQYGCVYQPMLLQDFMGLFANKEAAELAQYNVPNCIQVANEEAGIITEETEIERQDRIRENAQSESHQQEQKVVELYHVFVMEYGGGVDLWTVSRKNGKEIRHVEGLHEEMEDCCTLFTLQAGNDKFYGSKGLGRQLANIALAIERNRCIASDQIWLAGLAVLQGDPADILSFQPQIRSPFIIIPKTLTLAKEGVEFFSEAFEMMDNKLVSIGESIAGSFIPPNLDDSGSANTKIEAASKAEREQAIEKGVLGRFMGHAGLMISTMQRKICSAINLKEALRLFNDKKRRETAGQKQVSRKAHKLLKEVLGDDKTLMPVPESHIGDDDAVACIMEMLEEKLSIQEIAILAVTPAGNDEKLAGADKDMATAQFVAENVMNPNIDQYEATQMAGEIRIGADRTKRIMLKKADPNVEAEAVRQQLVECNMMLAGEDMPVVSTDRHDLHLKVLGERLQQIIPIIEQKPGAEVLKIGTLFVKHGTKHVMSDTTASEDEKKQTMEAFSQIQKLIGSQTAKLQAEEEKAQQAAAEAQQTQQPGPLDVKASEREDAKAMLDMTQKASAQQHNQSLAERNQAVKELQVQHDMEMDRARQATEEKSAVARIANETKKVGLQEASKDKKETLAKG